LLPVARGGGYNVIFYGENADDIGDFRPGVKAAEELMYALLLKRSD
jgi:PP-loop superfamily ATP-utilizing enzyme